MRIRNILLASAAVATLASCTAHSAAVKDPADLTPPVIGADQDNLNLSDPPPAKPADVRIKTYDPDKSNSEVTKLRSGALQEAAQSYGSQMGYARRAWEIEVSLQKRSTDLSNLFNFNRVVSDAPVRAGVIIPPVVSRSFDAFIVDDKGREASVADEYLTIVRPGRIAPVAPTWRDYLLFSSPVPEEPARSLLPQDRAESSLYRGWFSQGWQAGVELANAEFETRMDRLQQDYNGMLQYRRLVAMNMMDRMVLDDADFGVTEEQDQMRIDSATVRIVSDAAFQSDPTRWKIRSSGQREKTIVSTGEIPPLSLSGLK